MNQPRTFPLTEAQEGLFFAARLDPDSPALNTGQYLDIRGPLDVARFQAAVTAAIAEADALRLRFRQDGATARQWLGDAPRPDLVDLTARPDPVAQALARMQADQAQPRDLAREPLAAFTLFRVGPRHFLWYQRVHHLLIDGFGMLLLTNRVAALYAGTGSPLAPLSRALDADRDWRTDPARDADRDWWRAQLADLPAVTGLCGRNAPASHGFHRASGTVPADLLAALAARSAAAGVSWADALTVICAGYAARFTGGQTVAGIPFMDRFGQPTARVPAMVMNVLPFRFAADPAADAHADTPLEDTLRTGAAQLAQARRHGRLRSQQMRRDLGLLGGTRRLYGPLINIQPFDSAPRIADCDVALHILGTGPVDDISLTFRGDPRAMRVDIDANPALYSRPETQAHLDRLLAFVAAACGAPALAAVPTCPPPEAAALMADTNPHPVPQTTLTALLEAAFARHAHRRALAWGQSDISYAELDRRSAALAARLRALGAGPDRLVAVALPRSAELVVALVAVLRAGAAWLPLDASHPPARLAEILAQARPVALLGDLPLTSPLMPPLPQLAPEHWPEPAPCTGTGQPPASPQTGTPRPCTPQPDDLAYVIFTSGSTGAPKGVMIPHQAIVNRLLWMAAHYAVGPDDVILQKTPASFDVSVWEFFLPLITGATLAIAPPGAHRDPAALAGLIRDHGVSLCHFVPSMLAAFLAAPASAGVSLRAVFCSGEALPAALRDRFHDRIKAELHNLYGPTEAAVDVSHWPAGRDDDSDPVPIGWPVWNTRLLVLDDRMRPAPPGVAGRLFLGGAQLARGYLGRDDLTAASFVPDPAIPGARLYHSGDLARRRADGAIDFLGRDDDQVKLRGLRIELSEVASAARASGLVHQAEVLLRDGRLVAYVTPADCDRTALRDALAARLPDYMLPAAIIALPALPVTANGKLDRSALPAPDFTAPADSPARAGLETTIATAMAQALNLPQPPGRSADFFATGGDSLAAVTLVLALEQALGRAVGLGLVFAHPTVATLAQALQADQPDDGLGPVLTLARGDGAPLFLIHPAGGLAWGYRGLARAMKGRAVFGLQAPHLTGDDPDTLPTDLTGLAALYAGHIRRIAPEGPVHLAGWSVGGIIAQAVAVELGSRAGMVALLDAYPAELWHDQPDPDPITALRALLAIAGHDPDAHPELDSRDRIVAFLRADGGVWAQLPPAVLDGVIRAVRGTNALVRQHRHRHFSGCLTHLRAAADSHGHRAGLWAPHAARLVCHDLPLIHARMTGPQAVALIAPILRDAMTAAEETP
ncbi:amino acid adenylation domain-containing protein [Paracoccus jiaweipingae]|uniref:amino acid adenylation domain-containing protein n=1 Tax=unclassified Paracoccus (in: a-proteobacteria) TaxID=2688777 RepID=UPI003790E820